MSAALAKYTHAAAAQQFRKAGVAWTSSGRCSKGHQVGKCSHWNGYKVDVHVIPRVDRYVTGRFRYTGRRPGDGAKTHKSPAGNVYAREVARSGTHWDITSVNGNR
ncbi:hypothetical protein [Streptomyces noursei]|uniref:hypothetical protein n=1 Tax=Streptomyces noursei TaxID=1971 RepID=UPI00382905D9